MVEDFIISNLSELIVPFREHLKNNNSIVTDFTVKNYTPNTTHVWISDASKIIGASNCHYELITRDKKKISIEIHFEDKAKNIYYEKLKDNLPQDLFWNDTHKKYGKSIAYKDDFHFNDPNLLIYLEVTLIYLEENLGDKIRRIKTENYSIQEMEKCLKVILKSIFQIKRRTI